MTTQTVTEAILSINPYTESLFKAAHVIAEPDRKYKAKAHPEYPFLKYFFDPKFIVIISKQIHVYIIGDADKGSTRHVINLEGYHADHMVISKGDLTKLIKDTSKDKLFLPNNFYDRIAYMHINLHEDGTYNEELFIFNRISALGCNMFTSKSTWSIGADAIYDVDKESAIKERNTNAYEILNQIYDECGF